MQKFKTAFQRLPDPRADNARHDLLEVLFIALAAVLCGAESCSDMEEFGQSKEGAVAALSSPGAWHPEPRYVQPGVSSAQTAGLRARIPSFHGGFCQGQWVQAHRGGGGRRQGLARCLRTRRTNHAAATGQRLRGGCPHGYGAAKGSWSQRDGGCFGSAGTPVPGRLHRYCRRAALPPCVCGGGARAGRRLCSGDQGKPRALVHRGYATVCAIGQTQHCRADRPIQPRSTRSATCDGHAQYYLGDLLRLPRRSCGGSDHLAQTPARPTRRSTGRAPLSAVQIHLSQAAAARHAQPLGHREPAPLGARRSLRRGRKPRAKATMRPKTLPSCAGSLSTSCEPTRIRTSYDAKSSAPAGTTPFSWLRSAICDSPAAGGRGEVGRRC